MNWLASDARMVGKLIAKDWQVYQKQLAGYVAGMLFALGLVGMGTPVMASAGALVLLVLLLVVGSYAIQSSIVAERKQTGPFVMSLPVTPMDVYWGKLLANLVIYLVPFLLVVGGMLALILTTPHRDGAVPWVVLVAMFMLLVFCVSLCVAIAVDSEGWNIFATLVLMTLIGPYIFWVTRLDGVARYLGTDDIVWSAPVLGLLAAELAAIAVAVLLTSWVHARRASFL